MQFRKIMLLLCVLFFCGLSTVAAAGEKVTQLPANYPTTDTTYYGRWTALPASINFDTDGGTPVVARSGTTDETILPVLSDVVSTKAGYTFGGWWTGVGGTGLRVPTLPVSYPVGNVTYYAKWDAAVCNITFDTTGGSSVASCSGTTGTTITPSISGDRC